jgi:hypothetical protein
VSDPVSTVESFLHSMALGSLRSTAKKKRPTTPVLAAHRRFVEELAAIDDGCRNEANEMRKVVSSGYPMKGCCFSSRGDKVLAAVRWTNLGAVELFC